MFTYFPGSHGKHLQVHTTIDKHLNNTFLRSTSAERCHQTEHWALAITNKMYWKHTVVTPKQKNKILTKVITVLQKPTTYEGADWCIMGIKERAGSWRVSICTSTLSSTAVSWCSFPQCECASCFISTLKSCSAVRSVSSEEGWWHSTLLGCGFLDPSRPLTSPPLPCYLPLFPNSGLDLSWRAVQHFRVLWRQLLWKGQTGFSVG